MAPSSAFYRNVYSEIEEIGWQHLASFEEDLTSLSFRIVDEKGKAHILEIALPPNYPECAPSVASDVPYVCELQWSVKSRLKDVLSQFHKHLEKLQEFWSTLDDIDRVLWVIDPGQPSNAASFRQICIGNECYLLVSIDLCNPRSLPECRFLGPDSIVDSIRKKWRRNSRRWMNEKPFPENLSNLLEAALPRPPDVKMDDEQIDCGICYAQYLPVDDELGLMSGNGPDYACDGPNCGRAFHSLCLRDWLRSITTTRQSFDILFGNCPYCSGPVAVKVNNNIRSWISIEENGLLARNGMESGMSLEWNEAGIVISIPAFVMLRNQPSNRVLNSSSCVWYARMMARME